MNSKCSKKIRLILAAAPLWFILSGSIFAQSTGDSVTTAWRAGRFLVDTASVVGRVDIILGHANLLARQVMPLGNGRLGVAVWSADGLTAQLNRADTLPERLSPGQVVIPGLSALTSAKDYTGRLNLYDGEFREQCGGIKAATN